MNMETKNRMVVIEKDDIGNKVTLKLSSSGSLYCPQSELELECKEPGAEVPKAISFVIDKPNASMLITALKVEFGL